MVDNYQHQEKSQDFELIELLFGKVDSSTSNAVDQLDQSFEARYQSLVDQIQSYLHSSEKPGFFPHRFLGSFSSVLDTKLNDKLGIKKLHFRFEGAGTLKIVAETESKTHVFIFTEDIETQHSKQTNTKNFEFTTGEWKNVMGRDYTPLDERKLQIDVIKILKDKYELVKSRPKSDKDVKLKKLHLYLKNNVLEYKAKDIYGNIQTMQIDSGELKGNNAFKNKFFDEIKQFLDKSGKDLSDDVRKELSRLTSVKGYTLKSDGEDEKINIELKSKKKIVDQPIEPTVKFQEVTKKLGKSIYLEDYIEKLVSSDTRQAKENLKEILTYIKEVHTNLNLQGNVYGIKAREADQHGFVAGIFDNFRYRDNTKVYLEQFADGGYADIVLLVRGPNRAVDSVPILIELKAGNKGQVTPADALRQAEDYIEGFRPNKMRVLTNAGDAIAVGLNLDNAEPFKIEVKPIKQPSSPLMEKILTDIRDWDGSQHTRTQLEEQIKSALSSEYHTFPANKETKDHYYFSRDILGQSILINKVGQDQSNIKKYIYSYDEYPLNWPGGTEYTLSKSPVMTLMFVQGNEGQEKTAFIFHIRESNTKEFYADKKIPVLNIPGIGRVGNVIEIKMSLKKYETGLSFEELFEIERISKYNPSDADQQFTGNFLKIPNSDELKAKLDQAITSQHATSSDGEVSLQAYKVLLTEVADTIYPMKDLITNEARLQAIFNGLFSSYSDLKLQKTSAKTVIIPEFQVGAGGRVDMVIQGIGSSPQGTKEYTPIALEFKLIDKNLDEGGMEKEVDKLTKKQNVRYAKGAALKAITDSDKMFFMGVVVNMKAKDKNSLILTSDTFVPATVVHSSIHMIHPDTVAQSLGNLNLNDCVGQSSRNKRSINNCLFSRDDVEKFSKGKVDENNVDKIEIDSEKFLTYIKSSKDEGKNAQLIEFIGDKSIEGDHKYLLDKVIEDQGYERYIQNERIKDLHGDILQKTSSATKGSKLKGRLMNAAGGIQLIRGIHGAIVSCKDGTATDCGLNLGGIGWSFASQPIENVMVKITPKVVASAEKVVGKIIPGTLGKQTKFAIRVVGVKFGSTIARGTAGAVTGVFDIVDIGMSANNLVDCKKRENSDNPCGEKEIRDNIATISFSTISFVSGVALTALGMPGIGIAVGVALMVASGVYSGVSNIVEYKKKYDTTHDENWRIFWHTFAFQPIPQDVQCLAARKEMVNSLTKGAWQALNNSPNSTVAYGIGLGKVSGNTLRPDYAKILMNKAERANTRNLSRIIPYRIEDASRICLPQVTDQDYEKEGTKNSFDFASYYCENSMIISHDNRVKGKQKDKTIVYDLSNVNKGTIVGNNEWSNNFLIDSGTAEITGGNKVVNRFVVNNIDFSGKIIGGSNSINILDLSQLKDTVIGVNVDYRFKPNASGSLKERVNGRWLIDDQIDNNGTFNYYYVGRKNKVDEILCMGYSEHFTGIDDRDVIIDSGGGSNNNEKDIVENCKKVIILPYTTVKGGKSNYTFYVKAADYKGKGLHSEIDVDGTGTVIFPEINLLGDCDQITYFKNSNTLSLKINFGQNNQFTLDVKNYVEQSSNKPRFALIDKNGSNIVPKIKRSDSSTIKITSFELHSEHSLDNFDNVESHYKKILNNNKDYKVFSVIRGKIQNQDNGAVSHTVFGSSEEDIINFDQGTMFARGGEGSDVYIIGNGIDGREVKIDNNSNDKKLDTLFMSAVEKDFSIQQCDLYLKHNNSNIRVKNYLQDSNYRHLIVMNKKGETFIPDIQSMSCSSSSSREKLIPFLQATQTQNMFLLSKDFQGDHVVIDSRLEDIKKYKDKDDLLLIRESEIPFMIRIEGFYTERSKWENISYSLWNNDHFSPSPELLENVDNVMEHKDKLRSDYERVVKEYIEDFSNSTSIIQHNQKLEKNISTSVGQDEERIGVMILKNITPGQVEIFSNGADLIFRDKMSNHTIDIKDWDNNEFHRISTLEFDLGLEPITLRRLDRFSLSEVRKIQALIDKASENYQNRSRYTPKVENDFKCLISVDDFERGNRDSVHQCLDFPSLQDRVSFTESSCSLEQIEELKNKTPSSNQILTLLEKLENNLLLNGYDSNIIDQCNKWMISSGLGVLKPLVSTAVYEGKWDEVKTLLDKTAKKSNVDIEHKNQCSQNWTPLHYAIYNGNVELSKSVFKAFLEKKGNINALESTSCNDDNWALLHYAVHYGNLDMVSFLIDKGANIEIRSKEGKTPLYLAVEEAKQNIINLLLDRGADIEAKNNDGRTPLYLAAYNNNSGVIELLCNRIKTKSNDAFKMIKQVEFLKKEVVNQANIPSNAKRSVESCISSLRDSIKNAAKKVLKDGMLNDLNASTIKLVDGVYNFDKKLFGEAIKEAVNDVYWQVGVEKVLRFIRSHHYIDQFIPGYIAVFDKIPKNNSAIFTLAYSIKETMEMSNYLMVSSEERNDLERLKSKLPESVKNLVFSSKVCFKDVRINEYLCATGYKYDSDRRRVSTYTSKGGDECRWLIERSGNNVHIKNDYYGEYLYSAGNDFNYDSDRRRVFTWIPKNKVYSGWKIEPSDDKVYIKDNSGEFLYSANLYDGHDYGMIFYVENYSALDLSTRARGVFTWIPKGEFYIYDGWQVKNCSRSRERRDVTSLDVSIGTGDNKNNISLHVTFQHSNASNASTSLDSDIAAASEQIEFDNEKVTPSYRNRRLLSIEVTNNATRPAYLKLEDDSDQHTIVEDAESSLQVVDYKSILTEENSQQIASRVSAIVEDVERHTFLNQLKNKLDLDSYLNSRGRSNADLYPDSTRRDVCSELNASGRRNIVLSGNDVCAITSGYETLDIENFPIQEVVINDDVNGKKSLKRTLDLRQLVKQVDKDLSIKPVPIVIKDKNDLLIKLSISATGLQQNVITVRLKDALINKWYKKLQVIFDNAPVEIDDNLDLKSSFFISDEKIIVVRPQDIEENSKLIISKKAGRYTYLHDKYDLIVTNAFNAGIEANELCIIYFRDFYKEPKMKTLSIRFIDKEILLSNEIDKIYNSDSIDKLNNVSSIVNSQESSIHSEVPNSGDINAQGKLDRTLLHLASEAGEFDKVKLLLDRGANIEVQDKFGYTPIFLATQSGKWSVVELLLDRGANIDAQDEKGQTLLHFAASGNNLDMVQFLLNRGANIEVQDKFAWTPILSAAQSGKWDVVKLFISNGAKFNNEITYQGTPLHFAVQEGNLDMVRFLLDEGADIESQDKDNKKPLHLAVEAGRLNVVKLLLDRGASVNVTGMNSQTPLGLATKGNMIEILKKAELDQGLLINARDGNLDKVKDLIAQGANLETKDNTALHNACSNGHLKVVEYLIDKGASLKAKNKDGKIPLELAEQKGYTDIVEILKQTQLNLDRELLIVVEKEDLGKVRDNIRRGANVNAQSRLGWVSVFWAIQKNNLNIVKLLVNNGADINAKDNESWMPLHWAVQLGSLDVVKYLVERGANINALTADGRAPLELAVQKNCVDTIEFLRKAQLDLDKGLLTVVQDGNLNKVKSLVNQNANVNTRGIHDRTPLHFAASSDKFDIVKFLFDKNANIKAKDVYGNTPLHVAAQYGSELEIVEFLLDKNASGINDVNNNGSTPLHVAIQGNKPSTVKLLLNRGASIKVKDKHNRTPLGLADQEGYTNIAQMIEQRQSDLDEELLTAVRDDNLNEVEDLVSQNANVNTTDIYSWTPLHWATFKDHLEIARFLIKKGADINAADKGPYGKKPIHVAAENNSKDIIEFFLSKGVGINDTDKQGYTPLHYAAWRGRLEVAKFLIEKGADINVADASIAGKRPIHVATEENNKDIIEFFLSKGASVNDTDKDGRALLYWASWSGHLDLVKYFIDKGANINAECNDSKTPLDVAIDLKYNNVVEYLQRTQLDLNEQLLAAVQGEDFKKVKDLVSRGASLDAANIDAQDKDGKTPLHFAAQEGNLDMVQFFLNRGANIKAKDMYGWAPLHFASAYGKFDVVKFFLDSNINIRAKDRYGDTPLHLAAQNNDKSEIVESFLDSDANNINDRTNNGWTPLHVAVQGNKPSTVKLLLGRGADIEVKDTYGQTPLDLATQKGYTDIVKILEQEQLGKELFTAVREYDFSRVEKLISRGANIDTKNKNGKTPLDIAINTKNALEENQGSLNNALSLGQQGRIVRILEHEQLNRKLFTAVREENLPKVRELISRGANIDTERDGKTPLDIAKEKLREHSKNEECSDVVQCLEKLNQEREKPVHRKRRHHHGGHNRHHLSHTPLAIDSSNRPEVVESSGTRPSSWINSYISWIKKLAAGTFSIIPGLPAQYNIADKNDDINVKSDNNNIPQSISSVGWNNFLNSENIALASCVADVLDDTPSGRYQNLISKGVEVTPSREVAVEFALRKFDSFVEGKIINLESKEQARIRVELKDAYPEIIASLERGVEFSGNVGLDNVLEKCKKCFCTNVLPKDKVSTCLSDVGVTKLGNNLNR